MLTADKAPVLIHDETTQRTTGHCGEVTRMSLAELKKLKAVGGEAIPTFEEAGTLCRSLGLWANVEIKPAHGYERETGEAVARMARELWREAALQPVLSSFSLDALAAARAVAPELPRGYLVDAIPAAWREDARRVRCIAIHCNHEKLSQAQAASVREAGYGLLCWTVNDPARARLLLEWRVDCLVTDALRDIGPEFA
jgi:glycerophosphoryl diester phosphodiesterase